MVKRFGLLVLLFIITPASGFSFTPPPNDGFLTDATGVLTSKEELNIEDMLQEYAQKTGTEIAVIIAYLEGIGISRYRTSSTEQDEKMSREAIEGLEQGDPTQAREVLSDLLENWFPSVDQSDQIYRHKRSLVEIMLRSLG